MLKIFTPYAPVGERTLLIVAAVEAGILLLLWALSPLEFLPNPMQVWQQLGNQIANRGLLPELAVSLVLNLQALAIASALALLLAYGYVLPVVRPIANAIAGLRYLGIIGFAFVFMLLIKDSHWVKVAIIVFGILPYLTTSLLEVVRTIEDEQFQHARTLRLGHLGTTWEVIVRGRLDQVMEAIRQNAAIGWMMVAMVEGLQRAEGGVGVRLAELGRYLSNLPDVFAIILVVFMVGALQDVLLRWIRNLVCPYASLSTRSM